MRKKIILAIATIVIAIIAMVNVKINSQNGTLSDISMANIEALTGEIIIKGCCPSGGLCIVNGLIYPNIYPCSV